MSSTLPPSTLNRAPSPWILLASLGAVVAFAANSLLCREALRSGAIDPVSFSSLRLLSGALALGLALRGRRSPARRLSEGSWASAAALLVYALTFSVAYTSLSAGTGALVLFAAVQLTMIGGGLREGERIGARTGSGLAMAMAGLVVLLLPGMTAPSLTGASLMVSAGVAWGVYSLRARGVRDSLAATAHHFSRAVALSLVLSLFLFSTAEISPRGLWLAVLSGAVTSGGGYVLWHTAVRGLSATRAAAVQLAVPVVAAVGGIVVLAEPAGFRLAISGGLVLGGVAVVFSRGARGRGPASSGGQTPGSGIAPYPSRV